MFYGCAPSVTNLEEESLPYDRLVKKLEGNRRKIKSFVGTGVLNVESAELTAKGNFEVNIKKPDSISISIYGPWGIDLAHAMVTKRDFVFYDVMNNVVYKGDISKPVLREIFKVDLTFDELIDAFAGAVNLTDKLRLDPTEYDNKGDDYIMTYADSTKKVKSVYQISQKKLEIKKYGYYKFPNNLALQSTFSDFKIIDEVPIPYKIVVENKLNKQKINIEYRNITVNTEIEDMNLNIPSDAEIIEW
jgi:outer membrane lipoprotein-sorting protein